MNLFVTLERGFQRELREHITNQIFKPHEYTHQIKNLLGKKKNHGTVPLNLDPVSLDSCVNLCVLDGTDSSQSLLGV